jgi:hypothetical protein
MGRVDAQTVDADLRLLSADAMAEVPLQKRTLRMGGARLERATSCL